MATASSFLNSLGGRPPRYRTPSPPRCAVEPISPTEDFENRIIWNERSAFRPQPTESFPVVYPHPRESDDHGRLSRSDDALSHRSSGHDRSGSTIDTLATIALATSPPFAPRPFASWPPAIWGPAASPPPPLLPLQPDVRDWDERPAKRARSEKHPSPPVGASMDPRPHGMGSAAILDSMKTDAELLLNFARPGHFAPKPPPPAVRKPSPSRVENPSRWRSGPISRPGALPLATDASYGISPSRIRSHSDGSAALVRPVLPGVRPSTSAATLPPIIWEGDEVTSHPSPEPDQWAPPSPLAPLMFQREEAMEESRGNTTTTAGPTAPAPAPITAAGPTAPAGEADEVSSTSVQSTAPLTGPTPISTVDAPSTTPRETKKEDDSEDSNQASCASCHLVRISIDEDQGSVTWINCDGCKRWFHIVCAGFRNVREVRTVDKFICRECRPIHGPTTFVRKSSRARTAIDYAGLHQGLIKTSPESPEHHYIQPLKEGKIRFLPENFPRMRPELVTAEFFERGGGMTQPVIIPASLNCRRSLLPDGEMTAYPDMEADRDFDQDYDTLVGDAPTQEMFDELLDHHPDTELGRGDRGEEIVVDCGQDLLDMVIPEALTVRRVTQLYGPDERVEVIDVKSQQGEERKWNMQKWADYYESTGLKVVRNVISLEVSQSRLGRLLRRPKIVRDLDLQDSVWPAELKATGEYPKVQFYCLMSVADCYTDFHVDFGGSSVFYTILKGRKTFFFIPPKEKHLRKYEEWCNSPAQDTTFLGDQTKECYRVDLVEGDTMLIPAGWIHAVWTPENSLVIGGNFLTRLHYSMQIKVAKIEKDTKVPKKFRYPFFQKIQWYTALKYLEDDPIPDNVRDVFAQDEYYQFHRDYPIYHEWAEQAPAAATPGTSFYNARFYSQVELDGLPDLARYLLRTAMIAASYIVDGVSLETRNAIRRSIPRGVGDPIESVRRFAIWVAWKRGNEPAPSWTRPGAINSQLKIDALEKRAVTRPSRRSERNADHQQRLEKPALRQSPSDSSAANGIPMPASVSVPCDSRTSAPPGAQPAPAPPVVKEEASKPHSSSAITTVAPAISNNVMPKCPGLGPKRVACDACRKRRIRCRHKDEPNNDVLSVMMMMMQPSTPKPTTTDAFDETNLANASLARDAATVLNSLAAVATEASLHDTSPGAGDGLDGQRSENAPLDALRVGKSGEGSPPGKKGRSRACDECRRSKRRCIHDEYGRIDPVKAQERSKPRVAASQKRPRPSEDGVSNNKRPESSGPTSFRVSTHERDREERFNGLAASHQLNEVQSPPAEDPIPDELKPSYVSPPMVKLDTEVTALSMVPSEPATSLVSPPTSLSGEMDLSPDQANDDMRPSLEREPEPTLHTPTSSSRHSSRQPRQVDRYVPEVPTSKPPKVPSSPVTSASRPARKKSTSRPTSSHMKSVSPALDKKAATATSPHMQPSKGIQCDRTSFAESETDPESLRLIRELQEQEFGLRRRTARA